MSTLDELCEFYDDHELSGDTPFRIKADGIEYIVAAYVREPDGTVTIELEEETLLEEERRVALEGDEAPKGSIHWGGDGM